MGPPEARLNTWSDSVIVDQVHMGRRQSDVNDNIILWRASRGQREMKIELRVVVGVALIFA